MHVYAVPMKARRGLGNLWAVVSYLTWVLGTELRSFGRAMSAFNSPAPHQSSSHLLTMYFVL